MKLNVESQKITLLSVPIINQNAIVFLRRVVAFSLALTLIFTPIDFLITPSAVNLDPFKCENTIQRLLFFCVIPENYLIFGKWIAVALCFLFSLENFHLFLISYYSGFLEHCFIWRPLQMGVNK